jgi:ABC-type metal ion transport system, ATPase component
LIELIDVSKNFVTDNNLHIKAIRNINLKVEKKQIVGIIGHSGAGKSTLLRCINLLEIPTEGKVIVNGDDLTTLNKRELMQKKEKYGHDISTF